MSLGSHNIDDLLTFSVTTHRVDTGNATDADSVPTYRVYEDETATPILTGSMALLDSANTAGFYSEQITLSAANGFEYGKSYNIYITATVNSIAGATQRFFQVGAKVNSVQLAGQAITAAAGVTFPASVASPTNITAGTITTVTNLTNAPTAGDLTATMKTSVTTAATAATPTVAAVTAAVNTNANATETAIKAVTDLLPNAGALTSIAQDSTVAKAAALSTLSGIFTGITSLAQWLGLMAGKQVGNTTARTEIRATGAGSGTFDETTDSTEALRDVTALDSTVAKAATVATAASLATAQTSLNTIAGETAAILLDTGTDGVVIDPASKTGMRLSATGVDDHFEEPVDGTTTFRQSIRLGNTANGGKLSGAATTTATLRDLADTKARIIATVDADGNRTAVTLDLT